MCDFTDDEMNRAHKAKEALLQLLGDPLPDWAHHTGLSRAEDDSLVLLLYATKAPIFKLPSEIDGITLTVAVVGKIEALRV